MTKTISLKLDAEQLEYRNLAGEFARRDLQPVSARFDTTDAIPHEILRKMQALGLVSVRIPEASGGLGLATVDACLIAEELAFGCSGIASFAEASELACLPVILAGTAKQAETLLAPLTTKPGFAGIALSDFEESGMTLNAVQTAEGYLVTGTIETAINADIAEWVLIQAQMQNQVKETKRAGKSEDDWALFCLPTSLPGVQIRRLPPPLGRRAGTLSSVSVDKVLLTDEHRLHWQGGKRDFLKTFKQYNYPIIAAGCVGLARSALKHAIEYAKQRRAFGKAIAEHQAVAFMLADMGRAIESARLMTVRAGKAADSAKDSAALASAAKACAQDMAMSVTTDAVQIFGGYGYTKEYPVEKLMRDAKVYQIFFGGSEGIKGELGRTLMAIESG